MNPSRFAVGLVASVMLGVLPSRPAQAQAQEPSIKVLSSNPSFVNASTGDAYLRILPAEPAKLLITGPGRVQADLRVNLLLHGQKVADGSFQVVTVDVLAAGKSVGRLRVQPTPGNQVWKNQSGIVPSAPTGFYLDLAAGPKPYEFRVDGAAAKGVSLHLAPAGKMKTSLAANALVLPAQPVIAAATPIPTPAFQVPIGIDQLGGEARANPEPEPIVLAVALRGGAIEQQERSAFGPTPGSEAMLDVSYTFANRIGLVLLGEARTGRHAVPLRNDSGSPAARTTERRYVAGLRLDWTRTVFSSDAIDIDATAGLAYRLQSQQDSLAPHVTGLIGPRASVAFIRGKGALSTNLEYGMAVHDSTPGALEAGPVLGRLSGGVEAWWAAGSSMQIGLGYRREVLSRQYAQRTIDGAFAGVAFGF